MIGKCGYNYMKESLLIMHTRSKIQTSQNLIFKYLGISTTYTPQIVLFLGARCAPTICHLACLARCSIETTTPHTDQPPPPPTTTIRYRTRWLQCCYCCLLFAMLHAACHMSHATILVSATSWQRGLERQRPMLLGGRHDAQTAEAARMN